MSQSALTEDGIIQDHIKSISYNQEAIIKSICVLYSPKGIELDPTFSTGNFYRTIPRPVFVSDLEPQLPFVKQIDCRHLDFNKGEIRSIMFDPPFVVGPSDKPGIIRDRFSCYRTVGELWQMYRDAMQEFYRVLTANGILIFKCQDTVSGGKQYLSHVRIINDAVQLGFYPLDLFILLAKQRVLDNHPRQFHARKWHSYFIVFKKSRCPVEYSAKETTK